MAANYPDIFSTFYQRFNILGELSISEWSSWNGSDLFLIQLRKMDKLLAQGLINNLIPQVFASSWNPFSLSFPKMHNSARPLKQFSYPKPEKIFKIVSSNGMCVMILIFLLLAV